MKGTTEDEMVGWHHQLDAHEFEQAWEWVMDREPWRAVIHGVAKSWTQLNNGTDIYVCVYIYIYFFFPESFPF